MQHSNPTRYVRDEPSETDTFSSLEEADELNSVCSFCKRTKFVTEVVYVMYKPNRYSLVRCEEADCGIHCKFGHEMLAQDLPDGREDKLEMASGWTSHG